MDDELISKQNSKLHQIKSNLLLQFTKNKAEKFFNQNMYNIIDKDTLYIICMPSFLKSVEERDRNDHILISIYLYQINKFINLFKINMMNVNEKLDSKFFDSLHFISTNIVYTKFSSNRLLMRYGEEGKKFYLLLKGDVSILIPVKKIVNITINEYKRYIALLIIYKEYKILTEVLKENNSVYNMEFNFFEESQNYDKYIDLLQSIKLFNRGEEDNEEIEKDKNREIITQLLDLYLTFEEKKFYIKYVLTKKGKYHEENDDGIFLSPREYINRLNKYPNFDFIKVTKELATIEQENYFKKPKEEYHINPSKEKINLNEAKSFLIYDYHRVTELSSGEMFGDQALSSSNSKRTATIITLSECHFGFLQDTIYNQTIKEYNDKNRRNRICFLCNIPILDSFSYKLIEKRYYNKFVFKGAKMHEIILKQNELNDNIILFKDGIFEISFKGTIDDICDIIMHYMKQYESGIKRGNDFDQEIRDNILTMNRQRKKISRLFPNNINNEYDFKIILVNAPSVFGLPQSEKEEKFCELKKEKKVEKNMYYSFYTIKCYSKFCEYVLLNKKLFEEELMKDDKDIKAKRNIYLKEFYEKIIRRLLIISYGKIWNLLLESGIYTKNNRENIDWNKIELNHDFIKGINKIINEINEYKFSANDIDKSIDKYYEDKRIKRIGLRQKLKNVYNNKYSYNKIQKLLNSRNINELNFYKKEENPKNFKYINPKTLKKESLKNRKISMNKNNNINSKRNNSDLFNNRYIHDSVDRNKTIKKFKKNFSFFPDDKNLKKKSSRIILANMNNTSNKQSQKKFNSLDKNENTKLSHINTAIKKVPKKRISFYSPNINPFNRERNLRMHLFLYDTFKKFGESHSKNVVKNTKMVKYIEYEKNEINNDEI